jgi:hypothetical protein
MHSEYKLLMIYELNVELYEYNELVFAMDSRN